MKILSELIGVCWYKNLDGVAYYCTKDGVDWYDFRNTKLVPNKPIIVVEQESRDVLSYYDGDDPTMVGLHTHDKLDVYQLDSFLELPGNVCARGRYKFVDGEVITIEEEVEVRSASAIMQDLDKLRAELAKLQ